MTDPARSQTIALLYPPPAPTMHVLRRNVSTEVLKKRSTQKTQYSKIRTVEILATFLASPTTTTEVPQAF